MKFKILLCLAIVIMILGGCSEKNKNSQLSKKNQPTTISQADVKKIDLAKIKPNEAGEVMVIMYHNFGKEEKVTTRTPDNFKKDLETLYKNGYRAINLKDYVTGNINIPAGFSPVVLTFDDGVKSQFNVIEKNGKNEIDPNCAVGVMEAFYKEHPDFGLKATFFINGGIPFEQKDEVKYKLNYLVSHGMEIGNHTMSHVNLKNISAGNKIVTELSGVVFMVEQDVTDYQVNLLALPFGGKPKDALKPLLISDPNKTYKNIAIVQVGWDPYKSPYSVDFDPYAIHRIWGSDYEENVKGFGLNDWISGLQKGKRVKFISDGDPNKVTVPVSFKDKIDIKKIGKRELVTY